MNVLGDFKKIVNNERTFIWLCSLVLITLPLKHNINSVSLIVLLLYSIFFFLFNSGDGKLKINHMSIAIMGIYMLSMISLLWTISIEKSTEGLVQKLSYLIIPIVFILTTNLQKIRVKEIFQNFSLAMVFYAIYCMINGVLSFFKTGSSEYLFYHQLSSAVSNMNAVYMSVFIAFSLLFYYHKRNKQIGDYFCLSILSIFLVLLSSKIILATTIALLILPLFFKKNFKKLTFIALAFIFLTLFSKNIINRFNVEIDQTNLSEVLEKKEFGEIYHWTGTGLRLLQLRVFTELLQEDKLYVKGYGIDASQEKLKEKYKQYNLYDGFYDYDFHNQYVQIFSELGFLGFLILGFIFSLCFKKAIRNKDIFFLSFTILIAILCITESYLWRQRGMVFFITIALLFFKDSELKKREIS